MNNLLLIGLGGFLGALLRYGVSGFIQNWSKSLTFPYGTLAVNLLGCLLIGVFFLLKLVHLCLLDCWGHLLHFLLLEMTLCA